MLLAASFLLGLVGPVLLRVLGPLILALIILVLILVIHGFSSKIYLLWLLPQW